MNKAMYFNYAEGYIVIVSLNVPACVIIQLDFHLYFFIKLIYSRLEPVTSSAAFDHIFSMMKGTRGSDSIKNLSRGFSN